MLFLATLLAHIAAQTVANAYTVETVPNVRLSDVRQYVSDPSGILSSSSRDTINAICAQAERRSGVETAVVMLPSIGDADEFDFAQTLFERWGIGKKAKDNGVLVLFVMDKHVIRIHTGYGLEGVLPDAICKRIQQRYMIPAFSEGKWDEGMVEGVRAMGKILQNEEPDATSTKGESDDSGYYIVGAIVVGFILLVVLLRRETTRCPRCRKRQLHKINSEKLRLSTGRRVIRDTYMCLECGEIVHRDTPIDTDNGSDGAAAATGFLLGSMLGGGHRGGSFGGTFGGGSSGGGGASSRW